MEQKKREWGRGKLHEGEKNWKRREETRKLWINRSLRNRANVNYSLRGSQIAEESYENAPPLSSVDEVDCGGKASAAARSETGDPQQAARYTKDPRYTREPWTDAAATTADDVEQWPDKRPPPPVHSSTTAPAGASAKANDQRLKTDKDGYLETSVGTTPDDRSSGYLDATPGNRFHKDSFSIFQSVLWHRPYKYVENVLQEVSK